MDIPNTDAYKQSALGMFLVGECFFLGVLSMEKLVFVWMGWDIVAA